MECRKCRKRCPSFVRFDWLWGQFWAKKSLFWGHTMRDFGKAPPDLARPPRGATSRFLAQNLDLARAPPRLYDSYSTIEPEAFERSNGQIGNYYYYTPLPLNLANKQATSKQHATSNKHFSFPFWPPLRALLYSSHPRA